MGEMTIGPAFWAISALGLGAAIAYGAYFLQRPPSFLRAIVKTLFMGAGAAALLVAHAPFPLVLAIAASALGDFFLAFDKKWLLPLGILAFLAAQVLYVLLFGAVWFFSDDNSPLWPRYTAMAIIAAATLLFLAWLWWSDLTRVPITGGIAILSLFATGLILPIYIAILVIPGAFINALNALMVLMSGGSEPALTAPPTPVLGPLLLLVLAIAFSWIRRDLGGTRLGSMIYAGAIVAMACTAMWLPWFALPASLGALSFLVSDFVLAAELFRIPPDAPARRITAPVVWWTYVAAQALIVCGLVRVALAY
jgi:uncharacterized membrane protein YhhN